jgi:hypothetical protein
MYPPADSCYKGMSEAQRNTVRHLWWQCEVVRYLDANCEKSYLEAKQIATEMGYAHEVGTSDCYDTYVDLWNNAFARDYLSNYNNYNSCETSACLSALGNPPVQGGSAPGQSPRILPEPPHCSY